MCGEEIYADTENALQDRIMEPTNLNSFKAKSAYMNDSVSAYGCATSVVSEMEAAIQEVNQHL